MKGIEGDAKQTANMKKLLIYLLLIICFESFIASKPCYCHQQKLSVTNINVLNKNRASPPNEVDEEIRPLDIFTLRYF